MKNKSRKKARRSDRHQFLGVLSADAAERFLMECVNLPNPTDYPPNRPAFDRWLRRWHQLFTFQSEGDDGKWTTAAISRQHLEKLAPVVRTTLRRIWLEQDLRQRDWYLYRLRDAYNQLILQLENPNTFEEAKSNPNFVQRLTDSMLQAAPMISPFEAAIFWLQTNQTRMLHCTGPMCAAPFFFRTKKGQKFCSPACADPARTESKRLWWAEHRSKEARLRGSS